VAAGDSFVLHARRHGGSAGTLTSIALTALFIPPKLVAKQLPVVVEKNGSYSLDEVKTADTWIDGKPIYKKTINTGALPNASTKSLAHNIANIEWVVKTEAQAKSNVNSWISMDRRGDAADTGSVRVSVNLSIVNVATIVDMTAYTSSYVTVYYTKTTG
jgi:hypothetical protein